MLPNNVSTVTSYDFFGRPTLVKEAYNTAIEKRTATEYDDTVRRVITRSDLNTTDDKKLVKISHYDQLGRLRLSRDLEDAATQSPYTETDGVKVQMRYAFSGSNSYEITSAPYRANYSTNAGSEQGMAWKRTKFDNNGRVTELETFVGTSLPAPWGSSTASSGKVKTDYDAELTTVTDQAQRKRRSRVDGCGRLVRVDEPDGSGNLDTMSGPAQPTDYTYNALGNLIQTSQTGVPNGGSSPVTQTRSFNYSSLGRLTSGTNPESGTIHYEYDNNGNLTRKRDARGIFIEYGYDALNRNTTVNYTDTATSPDITRMYDNATAGAFGKGQFWKDYAGGDENTGATVEYKAIGSYDALGRPLSVSRRFRNSGTWSSAFTTSQTYDLAGNVKVKTYPSGHTTTSTYDNEGKLSSFTGDLGNGTSRTYSTGLTYNAQGQMTREQFMTTTALFHRRHYNARGQLYDVRLGTDANTINDGSNASQWTGTSWNRGALRMYFSSDYSDYNTTPTYDYNNGNLYRLDHFVPTNDAASQWGMSVDYFGYDWLNRVTGINEQSYYSGSAPNYNTFYQYFSYDRFGNRLVSHNVGTGVPNPGFKINGPNNRMIAPTDADGVTATDKMQYDLAGNLVKDSHTQGGTGTRTYDAENRMLTAVGLNGQTQSYVYDADGRRTRRVLNNTGEVWWQVFGLSGELVAEYQLVGSTPTLKKEFGHRSGQLLIVAEATSSNCQWLVTDALGTPRIIADQTGNLSAIKRRDYLPFGEEVLAGVGHRTTTNGYASAVATQPRQQFTGKERDNETGLDYFEARYYGSLYGRFTSPDEFTGGPDELYDFAEVASDNPTFYADLTDPQSLNKYHYCYNNPLGYVDPDGHSGTVLGAIIGGAVGATSAIIQGKSGKEIVASTIGGAVAGALIGSVVDTGGGTLVLAGALAGAAGGATERAILGKGSTAGDLTRDAAGGAAGAMLGPVLAKGGVALSNAVGRVRAAVSKEGIVYLRTNPVTGGKYVGQAESATRFQARQGEHDKALGVQHTYKILGRAKPGKKLDVLEETHIRRQGGLKKEGGTLENKKHQMVEEKYRAAGGKEPNS